MFSKLKDWQGIGWWLFLPALLFGWLSAGKPYFSSPSNSLLTSNNRLTHAGTDGNIDFDATHPAIAHNTTNDEYMLAWQADVGTDGEYEIFAQRLTNNGTPTGGVVQVSAVGTTNDTTRVAQRPAIAYNSVQNQYLIVWQADDDDFGLADDEWEIFGQRLDNAGTLLDTTFRISDMGSTDGDASYSALSPTIAYNTTNDQYLVVWQGDDNEDGLVNNEFEIFGQLLQGLDGTQVHDNDFQISGMGGLGDSNFSARHPAVAYNSTANDYLVVWQGDDNIAPLVDNEIEIFGRRVSPLSIPQGIDTRLTNMGTDGDITFAAQRPALAYNPSLNQYLLVWAGNDGSGGMNNEELEIFGQLLDATNNTIGSAFRLSDMGTDGDTIYTAFNPKVTYSTANQQYLVVWRGDDTTLADNAFEIFGQRVNAIGNESGTDFKISQLGNNDSDTAYFADLPALPVHNDAFIVWQGDDDIDGTDNELEIYGDIACANPSAETPVVTIAQTGTNDILLSWNNLAGNSNGAQILYTEDPYGSYQYLDSVTAGTIQYTHVGGAGDLTTNNFYVVQGLGNCSEGSTNSNITGEIDQLIAPGD